MCQSPFLALLALCLALACAGTTSVRTDSYSAPSSNHSGDAEGTATYRPVAARTQPSIASIEPSQVRPLQLVVLHGTHLDDCRTLFAVFGTGRIMPVLAADGSRAVSIVPPGVNGQVVVRVIKALSNDALTQQLSDIAASSVQSAGTAFVRVVASGVRGTVSREQIAHDLLDPLNQILASVQSYLPQLECDGNRQRQISTALRSDLRPIHAVVTAIDAEVRGMSDAEFMALTSILDSSGFLETLRLATAEINAVSSAASLLVNHSSSCRQSQLARMRLDAIWGLLSWINAAAGLLELGCIAVDVIDGPQPDVALVCTLPWIGLRAVQTLIELVPIHLRRIEMDGVAPRTAIEMHPGGSQPALFTGSYEADSDVANVTIRILLDAMLTKLGEYLDPRLFGDFLNRLVVGIHTLFTNVVDSSITNAIGRLATGPRWADRMRVDPSLFAESPYGEVVVRLAGPSGELIRGIIPPWSVVPVEIAPPGIVSLSTTTPASLQAESAGNARLITRWWRWRNHEWGGDLMGTALSILFPVGEVGPPEEASWNVHVIAAAPPPPPPPPPPPLASSPTERTGRFSCFLLSQPYGGCAARDDLDLCPSASGMTLTRVSRGYVLRVRRQQDAYVADMHNPMANVHFIFEFGNGGVASFQQSGTTLMGPMSCGYGCMRTGPCP